MCDTDISWSQHKYCQSSCFVTGNVYPGNSCCEAKENTINIPLYVPSSSPSTATSQFPRFFLSHKTTTADSWAPNQHQPIEPSLVLGNLTKISPSSVQLVQSSANPSNTLSSSVWVVPSKESPKGPSFIPSYS